MTPLTTLAAAALVLSVTALAPSKANAVSLQVKMACASDYFAHCSQHAVGSSGLRQCMRDAGPQLSKRCVNALVAAGEVSQAEVERRSASLR